MNTFGAAAQWYVAMTDAAVFLCVNGRALAFAKRFALANIVNGSTGRKQESRNASAGKRSKDHAQAELHDNEYLSGG